MKSSIQTDTEYGNTNEFLMDKMRQLKPSLTYEHEILLLKIEACWQHQL
jgi:hypothetical protein